MTTARNVKQSAATTKMSSSQQQRTEQEMSSIQRQRQQQMPTIQRQQQRQKFNVVIRSGKNAKQSSTTARNVKQTISSNDKKC